MRKEYEATFEEAVQVNYRLAELAGIITKQMWVGIALSPLLFLSILGVTYAMDKSDWMEGFVLSGLVTVLYIPVCLMTYKKIYLKHTRKFVAKMQGTDQPVSCEYELDEAGLVFRKMGQEIRFSWGGVKKINDTSDAIEVITEPLGIAIIPKRIFPDPAELQEWVAFIKSHAGT